MAWSLRSTEARLGFGPQSTWLYLTLSRFGFAWTAHPEDAFRISSEEQAEGIARHLEGIVQFGDSAEQRTGFGRDVDVVPAPPLAAGVARGFVQAVCDDPFRAAPGWTWEIRARIGESVCGESLEGPAALIASGYHRAGEYTTKEEARAAARLIGEALELEVRS